MEKVSSELILAAGLERSLSSLGIAQQKYANLPKNLRRLALKQAVGEVIRQHAHGFNWFEERSNLSTAEISDFTQDQIRNHQSLLDGLIALASLGDLDVLPALTSYLYFPEPRWSVLALPILESFFAADIETPVYRFPSRQEKQKLKIAVLKGQAHLFRMHGQSKSTADSLKFEFKHGGQFPEPKNETHTNLDHSGKAFSSWRFLSDNQLNYCYERIAPHIKRGNYREALYSINSYLHNNPSDRNYETISASVRDWLKIYESDSNSFAKTCEFFLREERPINLSLVNVLYDCLKDDKKEKDKQLCENLASWSLSKKRKSYRKHLAKLLMAMQEPELSVSLDTVLKKFSLFEDSKEKDAFHIDGEAISKFFETWITNLLRKEIEGLILVGTDLPADRHPSLRIFSREVNQNSFFINRVASCKATSERVSQYVFLIYDFSRERHSLVKGWPDELRRGDIEATMISYKEMFRNLKEKMNLLGVSIRFEN